MLIKETDAGLTMGAFPAPKMPDYVVVELKHDSHVAYSARGFAASARWEENAASLNNVLEGYNVKAVSSHFGMSSKAVSQRSVAAPSRLGIPVKADFAHAGFVQVVPRSARDAKTLARRLDRHPAVWKAFTAPRPVPAAVATGASAASRNFEPSQGYMHSAPNGIDAMGVWSERGGKGDRITVCDIEGNWNLKHEDLPRGIRLIGGTVINDIGWRNHGTAVLGEIVSRPNAFGTVGIAHKARAVVQSAIVNGIWNTAAAISNATRRLNRGDVILIELQGTGPRGRYVAMQYWDDVFSAIRAATARGIVVVEAAGNGNENFDLRIFRNTGLQKDSGAIVVGAGVPPTNYFDNDNSYGYIGVPRSRIWFSNYGKIVNVQAWGWHVTTLGYGDAQGGRSQNRWYTLRFSGTSSASPIVTGAVACIQGRAKAVRQGRPLTPRDVRQLLIRTGTPQQAGPGVPLSQHIGPQPNLQRAFKRIR
jgi:hypothetical protein